MEFVPEDGRDELAVRSQAGARERLDELGALREIEHAVLSHCEEHTRSLHISRGASI
jgi:hypothetical protein